MIHAGGSPYQPERVVRLRDVSEGYRAAADALVITANNDCPPALFDALFDLCQREAAAYEAKVADAE